MTGPLASSPLPVAATEEDVEDDKASAAVGEGPRLPPLPPSPVADDEEVSIALGGGPPDDEETEALEDLPLLRVAKKDWKLSINQEMMIGMMTDWVMLRSDRLLRKTSVACCG